MIEKLQRISYKMMIVKRDNGIGSDVSDRRYYYDMRNCEFVKYRDSVFKGKQKRRTEIA